MKAENRILAQFIAFMVVVSLIAGWIMMIAFMLVHRHVAPAIPGIDYLLSLAGIWTVVLLMVLTYLARQRPRR